MNSMLHYAHSSKRNYVSKHMFHLEQMLKFMAVNIEALANVVGKLWPKTKIFIRATILIIDLCMEMRAMFHSFSFIYLSLYYGPSFYHSRIVEINFSQRFGTWKKMKKKSNFCWYIVMAWLKDNICNNSSLSLHCWHAEDTSPKKWASHNSRPCTNYH